MLFSFGASAETRNQVANARVRLKVVTHRVFQARPESHVSGSSGVQLSSQSAPRRTGAWGAVGVAMSAIRPLHGGGADRDGLG